ncbi:MAG: helix-turn-helix domain-containing protein [Clostridium sp.]|nr:helix-turn-helix domain-containing protein [Clostridium sp.]
MSFSEKLYILRSRSNLSQAALAEGLDVSRQTISKWELGSSYPEIDKLVAISNFFHVTTDYLLKDDVLSDAPSNLDRLVLEFLGSAQDMEQISNDLVEIMRDGVIDESETARMHSIIHTLDSISRIIEDIRRGLCSGISESASPQQTPNG